MSASEEAVSSDTGATSMGPGERLQAARIKQGLSIEDVANRMHLSTGILEALEENNFEEITAPIFVKGYLRAYARIVSLDEEEMIGLYTEYHRDDDPPISTINNVGSELTAADARIRWTTYLVVLVLVTLLGAWWWNRQNIESTPISLDSQADEETRAVIAEPEPVIEAVSESVAAPRPSPESSSGPAVAAGGDAREAASPVGEALAETPSGDMPVAAGEAVEPSARATRESPAASESATRPAPAAEVAQAAPEPVVERVETAVTSTGSIAEEPAPAAAARLPAVIAPSGSDRLTLAVNADTWADIKDGSGFRLVYDLLRSGSSVELTGEAPFAVFLGNGHGVELQYNGEPVDFSADIRDNNTARLSIGE